MGSGFIQRLKSPASTDFYKSIEGVYIIDQGGPAFVKGQGTGRVAIIGEFADMLYAVAVDSSGNVTSRPQPVQIFGADDLVAKLGDFDSTLGDIGGAGGNGFLDIDGCAYTELVAVPVNLCSSKGVRVWRALPTNRSATDPSPVVPISAGTVAAGREFRSGSNRVKLGTRVLFKQRDAYLSGIDGSVTAVAGVATAGSVTSSAGPFVIRPGYVTHISIDQGANQVWTWGGTAAKCKMAAAGAYVGGVSGTFDIQWADESGSHTNTITIDGTVAILAELGARGTPLYAITGLDLDNDGTTTDNPLVMMADGSHYAAWGSCADADGDGYGSVDAIFCASHGVDCDDGRSGVNPGAAEIANDGIDQDCSGADLVQTLARPRPASAGAQAIQVLRRLIP